MIYRILALILALVFSNLVFKIFNGASAEWKFLVAYSGGAMLVFMLGVIDALRDLVPKTREKIKSDKL